MRVIIILTLLTLVICANARSLTKRDAKSDLLAEVDEYVKKGKTEIENLIKDNQKSVADSLQKDMEEIVKVSNELKTTTGPEAIKLMSEQLEKLLGAFKAKVNVLIEQTKNKDLVISSAEKLVANGEEEVKKLMASARIIEGHLLELDVNKLKTRVEALKSASDNFAIKALEIDINVLSVKISTSLKLLGFVPSTAAQTIATAAPTKSPTTPRKDSTAKVTMKAVPKEEQELTVPPTTNTPFVCDTHPF